MKESRSVSGESQIGNPLLLCDGYTLMASDLAGIVIPYINWWGANGSCILFYCFSGSDGVVIKHQVARHGKSCVWNANIGYPIHILNSVKNDEYYVSNNDPMCVMTWQVCLWLYRPYTLQYCRWCVQYLPLRRGFLVVVPCDLSHKPDPWLSRIASSARN